MTDAEYVQHRYQVPVYVSDKGDILADHNGMAIVATARELAMNKGAHRDCLWAVRFHHMRHRTADFLGRGGWRQVGRA